MRKLIYYILPVALLGLAWSCGGSEESTEEGNPSGIKISGEIEGGENQRVVIWVFEDQDQRILDSTFIKDGKFTLWTETKELREYAIQIGSNKGNITPINNWIYLFPDESAGDIEITAKFPNVGDNYTVKGDQNSEDFQAYFAFRSPYYKEIAQLKSKAMAEQDTNLVNQYLSDADSIARICRDYSVKYINEKPGSPVSWVMLNDFYPPSGLLKFDTLDFDYFVKVSEGIAAKYPNSEYPEFINGMMESTQIQLEELRLNPDGDRAPELAYNNPDGELMKLSDLRGQVVLVDFWASWCGPCRLENPNVVAAYEKYKDKGFTIFSVSLDNNKEAWVKAIEADNLDWPYHVSDLKGWGSEAAALYDVTSIPASFLLDASGRIIDQNLRGERLEQRLQEILG